VKHSLLCFAGPCASSQSSSGGVPELNCSHDAFLPMAQGPIPAFGEIYIVGTSSGRAQNRLQLVLYAHPKLTGNAEILFAGAGEEVGHDHRL
jgi:hypothetical protein